MDGFWQSSIFGMGDAEKDSVRDYPSNHNSEYRSSEFWQLTFDLHCWCLTEHSGGSL
jgi:hypothetical protein